MRSSTILASTAVLAARALAADPPTTFSLKVSASDHPTDGLSLTRKVQDLSQPAGDLGVWGTSGPDYPAFVVKTTAGGQDGYYQLLRASDSASTAMLLGDPAYMSFMDIDNPESAPVGDGSVTAWDMFSFSEASDGYVLRYGEDNGRAGSWRACNIKGNDDYYFYWYDGLSPLEIENCIGVQLTVVAESDASSTATTKASGTVGPAAATSSISGWITGVGAPTTSGFLTGVGAPTTSGFLTGVGAPTTSGFLTGVGAPTTSGFLTGVPAPTGSGNGTISGVKSGATPTPTHFQGDASKGYQVAGLLGVALGVMGMAL